MYSSETKHTLLWSLRTVAHGQKVCSFSDDYIYLLHSDQPDMILVLFLLVLFITFVMNLTLFFCVTYLALCLLIKTC